MRSTKKLLKYNLLYYKLLLSFSFFLWNVFWNLALRLQEIQLRICKYAFYNTKKTILQLVVKTCPKIARKKKIITYLNQSYTSPFFHNLFRRTCLNKKCVTRVVCCFATSVPIHVTLQGIIFRVFWPHVADYFESRLRSFTVTTSLCYNLVTKQGGHCQLAVPPLSHGFIAGPRC